MVSFKEFYNNKIDEAATPVSFDDMISQSGAAFKTSKAAKTLAADIVKKASKELKDDFLQTAMEKVVSTNTEDYRNLALAIDVLSSKPTKADKEILDSLNLTPEGDDKIGDLPIIQNVRKGTKPYIKSIKTSKKETPTETPKTPEAPKAETEAPKSTEETPKAEKETSDALDLKTADLIKRGKETQRLSKPMNKVQKVNPDDPKGPSNIAKQAEEALAAALEKVNDASEKAVNDVKKMKMKKVATDMEKAVNKKINSIKKEEQRYSNFSNFSSRLKATTNSQNYLGQVKQIINAASNKAQLKSMDNVIERIGGRAKEAASAIKKGTEKVTQSRTANILKQKLGSAAKVAEAGIKRGAKVAAPIIKSTTDKVKSKIKSEVSDAIIKKWAPKRLKEFIESDDPAIKAKILADAKAIRDKARADADKARRLVKRKVAPNVTTMRGSESPTKVDIPVEKYPRQSEAK